MIAELKECPFCGNMEDLMIRKTFNQFSHEWFVKCPVCGTRGPYFHIGGEFGKKMNYEGESAAIEAWNRRNNDG